MKTMIILATLVVLVVSLIALSKPRTYGVMLNYDGKGQGIASNTPVLGYCWLVEWMGQEGQPPHALIFSGLDVDGNYNCDF